MHKFCNDCKYLKLPNFIKEKYNEFVFPKFLECPLEDNPKVAGCVVKHFDIDIGIFIKELINRNMLEKEEISELVKLELIGT